MSDYKPLIEQPQGAALIACLGFLYDSMPVADRARQVAETMRNAGQGSSLVLAAKKSDRFIAAWAVQFAPGGQAMVAPPRLLGDEGREAFPLLCKATESAAAANGVNYLQASLPIETDYGLFLTAGFEAIAKLSYLVADVREVSPPDNTFELEPYDESQSARLMDIIEATYFESLDCPNVGGMRKLSDVVEGYRSTGQSASAHWYIARDENQDVGCLLLSDHSNLDRFELVYMGLNKNSRGRGWGKALAEFAKWQTRQAGRKQIIVAVDSENSPAISTYSKSQFHLVSEQQVLAKRISANTSQQDQSSS